MHCQQLLALVIVAVHSFVQASPSCRTFPTDDAWPTTDVWDTFNRSIDGRLIKTIPVGTPCHDPAFNEQQCDVVRENWHDVDFHEAIPASIMNPIFLNQTCDPFTPRNRTCTLGGYVEYAVNVSSPDHVIKTVQFVKKHNIRFVVKNTGHDYMGRSTGAGAVSVWMHNLQNVTWYPMYRGSGYTGAAIKAQGGLRGVDLVAAAHDKGHVIVGGQCPTVGFVGGYIQGGGHSVLSSVFGLAADQALEYEVVTTGGQFITASPTENEDLFWALSGGGGGTYGIVWSVTVKAFLDQPVTLAFLNYTSEGISPDTFWRGIETYLSMTPNFTDQQAVSSSLQTNQFFLLSPLAAFNKTPDEVAEMIAPLRESLDGLGIEYQHSIEFYTNYLDAFNNLRDFGAIGNTVLGSWLIPRSVWNNQSDFQSFMNVSRQIIDDGGLFASFAMRPTRQVASDPRNAVLAAWRDAEHHMVTGRSINDTDSLEKVAGDQGRVTNIYDAALKRLAPNSGAYVNEADSNEPDFKKAFYGANYDRLLAIKDKWDPEQILYGSVAVGGDRWHQTNEGKLCRVQ